MGKFFCLMRNTHSEKSTFCTENAFSKYSAKNTAYDFLLNFKDNYFMNLRVLSRR